MVKPTKHQRPGPHTRAHDAHVHNAQADARASGAVVISDTVELIANEIHMDESWNGRSYDDEYGSGDATSGNAELGQQFTDEQLRNDIACRGLLQPLRVRLVDDRWTLVFGFRRLRACLAIDPTALIPCTVQPSTEDEEEDDFEASSANLSENLNRRELRSFEIAEKLWVMHQARPDMTRAELAEGVGLSKSYCAALLRIKERLHPELWKLFCRFGARGYGQGITYKDMLHIIQHTVTRSEQLDAWDQLVLERIGGGDKAGAHPKSRRRRATDKQIAKWLKQLGGFDGSTQFRDGARYGLGLALGTETWKGANEPNDDPSTRGASVRRDHLQVVR